MLGNSAALTSKRSAGEMITSLKNSIMDFKNEQETLSQMLADTKQSVDTEKENIEKEVEKLNRRNESLEKQVQLLKEGGITEEQQAEIDNKLKNLQETISMQEIQMKKQEHHLNEAIQKENDMNKQIIQQSQTFSQLNELKRQTEARLVAIKEDSISKEKAFKLLKDEFDVV